jgi:hypothetical protein
MAEGHGVRIQGGCLARELFVAIARIYGALLTQQAKDYLRSRGGSSPLLVRSHLRWDKLAARAGSARFPYYETLTRVWYGVASVY